MAQTTRAERLHKALEVAASLATMAAALAVLAVLISGRGAIPDQRDAVRPSQPPAPTKVEGLETVASPLTKHHPGAKLAIVEFSDFQCPFCGRYARDIYPTVVRELVDTGEVDYVFRHFPLEQIHRSAYRASEAVECAAEQGRTWQMHDWLFANQRRLGEDDFLATAPDVGVDDRMFQGCLERGAAARIDQDVAEGQRLGVESTPTFLLGTIQPNGTIHVVHRMVGARPFETIKSTLASMLP